MNDPVSYSQSPLETPEDTSSRASAFSGWFLFPACRSNPELERHARLIAWFGVLGFLFCMIYASFYWYIGHVWGMRIIALCSVASLTVPFIMRACRAPLLAAHLLMLIMTAEFLALCCVEGGLQGHAFAWLAVIPLCALLLMGRRGAYLWTTVCVLSGSIICIAALNGTYLPVTYDTRFETLVSSTGYLGLILFMFLIGVIFEVGREKAFHKVQEGAAKLAISNKKLLELNQEKTEFLGIAAHDLKSPLTGIIGAAELLKIIQDPLEVKEIAGEIMTTGTRMRDLIANLLSANAIEEGRFISNIGRCDLNSLVQKAVDDNLGHAGRKGIALHFTGPDGLMVQADKEATLQILDNLISNAIKYAPSQSKVAIQSFAEKGCMVVSIQDEGPGLSEDDQSRLFQKFTRLSAKPTGGESSHGLGLSIVDRLAKAMNGSVECRSVLGAGATFFVRLPEWRPQS